MLTSVLLVAVLGIVGGVITTVAGLGGGLVMVAVLSILIDPVTALSATAIGLLVGNLHRVILYRRHLDWRTALPVILGAVPGAIVFGLMVAWMPDWLIFGLMLGTGLLAIVRAAGWDRMPLPAWAGVPVGVAVGGVTATSGGGGLIVAPWMLARGLVDAGYVGTVALVAASLHLARIAAYGVGGASDPQSWMLGGLLALCLPLGNLLGHAVRTRLDLRVQKGVQLAVIVVALLGAGYGLVADLVAAPAIAGG